ncbi:hypothetical protein OEZ49_01845 [Ruegeria sp. WL0004]|uniref:Uncharacterized protein n=1 Tax=Ruegeria marisflavi TaxID=2984152 RepID=A0ABT2WNE3_9RHOB|nr:hypothetical protein [Ruegeria sp. WL0004]MCU9836500.1 hypothetical protein [Ruegeria sp. WL0004]
MADLLPFAAHRDARHLLTRTAGPYTEGKSGIAVIHSATTSKARFFNKTSASETEFERSKANPSPH